MTPSVGLIVIAGRVNIATPIKLASDRQSLDFYRSYKLSNYLDSSLVFSTRIPRVMHLGFQYKS